MLDPGLSVVATPVYRTSQMWRMPKYVTFLFFSFFSLFCFSRLRGCGAPHVQLQSVLGQA